MYYAASKGTSRNGFDDTLRRVAKARNVKYGLSSAILQRTIEDIIRLVTSNHMIRTSFEHVEQVRKNNAANRDRVEKLEVELTHSVQRTEVLEAEKASSEEEVVAATDGADQIRQSCYVARKMPRIFEIDNNISVFARLLPKRSDEIQNQKVRIHAWSIATRYMGYSPTVTGFRPKKTRRSRSIGVAATHGHR